jgi:hypothetical protein
MMDATDRIIYAQTSRGTRIGTARDTIGALRNGMKLIAWYAGQARVMGFRFNPRSREDMVVVRAEINHGRWLVRCPFCSGAEEANPGEPVFYCLSCGNADFSGRVMLVAFPDERGAIEAALLRREMGNRNWSPGESLADLVRENAEHGVSAISLTDTEGVQSNAPTGAGG